MRRCGGIRFRNHRPYRVDERLLILAELLSLLGREDERSDLWSSISKNDAFLHQWGITSLTDLISTATLGLSTLTIVNSTGTGFVFSPSVWVSVSSNLPIYLNQVLFVGCLNTRSFVQ